MLGMTFGLPAILIAVVWFELRGSKVAPPARRTDDSRLETDDPRLKAAQVATDDPRLKAAQVAVRSHHAIPALLAIGCLDPAVNDDESLALLRGEAGPPGPGYRGIPTVFCKTEDDTAGPACADVASAYLRTTKVATPYFNVIVLSTQAGAVLCHRRFGPDGTDRGESAVPH
jgi:hypothetical protein